MAVTNSGSVNVAGGWTPGTPISIPLGFTTTVGRELHVLLRDFDGGLTYTLVGAGTWTQVIKHTDGVNTFVTLAHFATRITSAVSAITIDADDNGTSSGARAIFCEVDANPAALDLDDNDFVDTTNGSTSAVTSTTLVNPSLLLAMTYATGGVDPTKDAAFTSLYDDTETCAGYRYVTTPGAYTWTATLGGGPGDATSIITATASASAGGNVTVALTGTSTTGTAGTLGTSGGTETRRIYARRGRRR
jgi:hypothetical protein